MDEMKLLVQAPPHIRSPLTTKKIMFTVVLALVPAASAGVVFFGIRALFHMLLCITSAVLTEFVIQKMMGKKVTITDGSAVVTGLLLGMNLPVAAPLWIGVVGSGFAIAIVKHTFGGLGQNFMNPALAARAMLMAAWRKAKIRMRLKMYRNCIRWGGDYRGRKDEMHFEINRSLEACEFLAKRLMKTKRGKRILAANPGQKAVILS